MHTGRNPQVDEDFLAQARRCRRLATAVSDTQASELLDRMADDYEARAAELRAVGTASPTQGV